MEPKESGGMRHDLISVTNAVGAIAVGCLLAFGNAEPAPSDIIFDSPISQEGTNDRPR
ncbi:MAG: hypothetical protein V4678_01975 [Patescibacteria group bacterium]